MPEGFSGKNINSTHCKIKVKNAGPHLNIIGANVRSISQHQYYRRLQIKAMLGKLQPDLAIFVETNLVSE